MKLKVITPKEIVLDISATSVTLPGELGQMTILPGHAAFVSTLKKGIIYYRSADAPLKNYQIESGFVEVLKDQVLVMTPTWRAEEASPSTH